MFTNSIYQSRNVKACSYSLGSECLSNPPCPPCLPHRRDLAAILKAEVEVLVDWPAPVVARERQADHKRSAFEYITHANIREDSLRWDAATVQDV
jgi:hypothetical protein